MKILILFFASFLFAQQVSVDLASLPSDARNAVIESNKKIEQDSKISTDDIEKYTAIGKAVGIAFKEVCQTLNVELNEFIKTPAGKLTMFMVAWKIFGQELVHLIGGISFAFIMAIVWIFVFRFFYSDKKKWKYKDGKKTDDYDLVRFTFVDKDNAPVPAVCLVICAIAIIVVALVSIFGF
jgi:hypothetical protein